MLLASTYFFYIITPRLRRTSAHLRPGSGILPGLTSTVTSSYQPKRNHQMSTTRYKHSGTPTSSFFFTNKCTLSGTPHTARPYMYQPVVHHLERTPFHPLYHHRHYMSSTTNRIRGNTCWDNIPTLSPPMCHTHRFHYRSKM